MKISEEDAFKIAKNHVSSTFKAKMKIVSGGKRTVGWVFYYNSFEYMTTKERRYFLWGCYPIIVTFEGRGHITSPYWNGDDEDYLNQLVEAKSDF